MRIDSIKSGDIPALNLMFYSGSGTGKTFSALTFPNLYLIDFDGGVPKEYWPKVKSGEIQAEDYTRTDGWKKFREQLRKWKAMDELPFDTLIWDSLTTSSEALEYHIKSLNNTINDVTTLREYNLIMGQLQDTIADFTDLPCISILTAHEQMIKDEITGKVHVLPLVTGKKLPGRLPLWFDEVYKCVAKENKESGTEYLWCTQATEREFAKSRLSIKDKYITPTYETLVKLGGLDELETAPREDGGVSEGDKEGSTPTPPTPDEHGGKPSTTVRDGGHN